MTHDEMIAVITHHKNGGKVEVREINTPHWHDCDAVPWWNFISYDYRAKPEPLTVYAEVMPSGKFIQFGIEDFNATNGGTIKKFVEVEE